jgi:poly(3-hydroxybutyrate) depolymerase
MNANFIDALRAVSAAVFGCVLCVSWNVAGAEEVVNCEELNLPMKYVRPADAEDTCPLKADLKRSYILCVPSKLIADPEPVPLVLVFHGAGGAAGTFKGRIQFELKGAANEFITAYPNGCRKGMGKNFVCDELYPLQENENGANWNGQSAPDARGISERCKINDVSFIDKVIDDIKLHYSLTQIFAFGHSKGGIFAYTLACDRSNVFSAIGVTASTLTDATCAPSNGVSIFHVHNLQDENVPFYDGGANKWPSAEDGLKFWETQNNCTLPINEHDFSDDMCLKAICSTDLNFELCLLDSIGPLDSTPHNYNTYDAAFMAGNKKHKNIRDAFVERYLE